MQPNSPQPNYDFIMNSGAAPKKSLFSSGSSMATRLLVIVVGLFILVLVLGVAFKAVAGGGGSFNKAAMLSVAQDQTEIIRVSTLGVQSSVSQTNKNFSITAQLGLTSKQQSLLAYLDSRGYSPKTKSLALKHNAQTDSQLTSAQSSSTFDETYRGIMQKQLQGYESDLSAAYKGASPSAKKALSDQYDAAQLLLTQLNSN